MRETTCMVCEWRRATRRGMCHTCYVYYRRHGVDRSEDLIVRHGRRVLEKMQAHPALHPE